MDLPKQVTLHYALIQCHMPNQVGGVPAFGDPLENTTFERVFFPKTLHLCLSLLYILIFIIIHKVPESSLPPQHTLSRKSYVAGGSHTNIVIGGLYSHVTCLPQYPKKGTDTADSCTMVPFIVKGLFRTILLSRRTGRKIKPSRRIIRDIKISRRTIKLSGSNMWVPARGQRWRILIPPRPWG